MDYGLWYPKGKNFTLKTYTDEDQANCVDDKKNKSGGAFYIGESLVALFSKKKSSMSISTVKVEYIAVATCCTQALWMKQILQDMKVTFSEPIFINCDNTSAISISKNPMLHSKTKDIPIKCHFLRAQVDEKTMKLEIKQQIIDIFTKPLARESLEYPRNKSGIVLAPSSHQFDFKEEP